MVTCSGSWTETGLSLSAVELRVHELDAAHSLGQVLGDGVWVSCRVFQALAGIVGQEALYVCIRQI